MSLCLCPGQPWYDLPLPQCMLIDMLPTSDMVSIAADDVVAMWALLVHFEQPMRQPGHILLIANLKLLGRT